MLDVKIKLLNSKAKIPCKMSEGASGYDIFCTDAIRLYPNQSCMLSTGVSMEIHKGYEGQLRIRSSLSKHKIILLNGVGTIDSDYRGEIMVPLFHNGNIPFDINKGDRIAQLVFTKVEDVNFIRTNKLSETKRGKKGFGSTGI